MNIYAGLGGPAKEIIVVPEEQPAAIPDTIPDSFPEEVPADPVEVPA